MTPGNIGSPTAPNGRLGEVENALSYLQCVLVAWRTRSTPEPITWQQYDVLESLRIHGPMTPSAISASLAISRPTTSKALRVLKDEGLISQSALDADRREQMTSLTPVGQEFLLRAARSRRESAQVAAAVLSPDEQRTFAALCERVAEAMYANLNGDAPFH